MITRSVNPSIVSKVSKMNTKDTWHLGRQMSHLSAQKKLDSFFKPALLRSKTSTIPESSLDE
jgi:hypothetical protein